MLRKASFKKFKEGIRKIIKITDKGVLRVNTEFDEINKHPKSRAADEIKKFVSFYNYRRLIEILRNMQEKRLNFVGILIR